MCFITGSARGLGDAKGLQPQFSCGDLRQERPLLLLVAKAQQCPHCVHLGMAAAPIAAAALYLLQDRTGRGDRQPLAAILGWDQRREVPLLGQVVHKLARVRSFSVLGAPVLARVLLAQRSHCLPGAPSISVDLSFQPLPHVAIRLRRRRRGKAATERASQHFFLFQSALENERPSPPCMFKKTEPSLTLPPSKDVECKQHTTSASHWQAAARNAVPTRLLPQYVLPTLCSIPNVPQSGGERGTAAARSDCRRGRDGRPDEADGRRRRAPVCV